MGDVKFCFRFPPVAIENAHQEGFQDDAGKERETGRAKNEGKRRVRKLYIIRIPVFRGGEIRAN